MIHILSSSTLFPYTTLFRSHRLVRAAYLAAFAVGGGAGNIETHLRGATTELVDGPTQSRLLRCIFGDPFRPLDRKSTRLNSSHANISYAVFCLNKKIIF